MDILNKILNYNKEKILIYGDIIIDLYKNIYIKKYSSECPILVFEGLENEQFILGGAGNVLNNLLIFNELSQIISIIEDKYINSLILAKNLINIVDENYKNIIKTRFFSNNHQTFRIDTPSNYIMSENTIINFKNKIDEIISNYKVIIISDYNTGIVNEEIVKYIISLANKLNITTLIDPKNKYKLYENSSIIKFNKNDAEIFSNKNINNINDAYEICDLSIKKLNVKECLITLSENGCVYKNIYDLQIHVKNENILNSEIIDVTGAGDTFISTFAIGLLNKLSINDNLFLCNLCCSDVITRKYVSIVNMLNIFKKTNFIFNENNCNILKKFFPVDKKIVFTSGCFDLLHEGHIEILKKGKELGDILIVAINDDDSIKINKTDKRPINTLHTRLTVLSSIKYVDFLIIFSESTPNNIYNILEPDIVIKGDDYTFKKIKIIFPNIKNFISIPLINNISTTNIINKIKKIY